MHPKDAYGMANSVDPDQTGLTMFAQTCLSKKLGPLQYLQKHMSRLMTKPTKWHVRPAKTQISLGIHPV